MGLTSDDHVTLAAGAMAGALIATGWVLNGRLNRSQHVGLKRDWNTVFPALEGFLPVFSAIEQEKGTALSRPDVAQAMETARVKFQLYGYKDEINLMERFVTAVKNGRGNEVDEYLSDLISLIRTRLRRELSFSD